MNPCSAKVPYELQLFRYFFAPYSFSKSLKGAQELNIAYKGFQRAEQTLLLEAASGAALTDSAKVGKVLQIANKGKNSSLQKIDSAARSIEEFFEGQGKVITNADGDMVLVKGDKKIRFDINDPHSGKPHFHLEKKES